LLHKQKIYKEAIADLEIAIKLNPDKKEIKFIVA
jgi:hypothetical protein